MGNIDVGSCKVDWDTAAAISGDSAFVGLGQADREKGNQSFTAIIAEQNDAPSIDNDILDISGHIFPLQNSEWVEAITLAGRFA